uniref:Uncharacterized protein LOC109687919 n=1 Tax=Castor canadensis TaxID=51338 RepID=A0A8B7UTP0_CASCN|nr:uncharacterized protein LOC109687919 [Castor canadensis]
MGGLGWRRGNGAVGVRGLCAPGRRERGAGRNRSAGGGALEVGGPRSLRPPGRGVAIGRCRPLSARPGGGEEDAAREPGAGDSGDIVPTAGGARRPSWWRRWSRGVGRALMHEGPADAQQRG